MGDIIRFGECRVIGSFDVPSGVTLAGVASDASLIQALDGQDAIRLIPGPHPTRIVDLGITVSGGRAIAARDIHVLTLRDLAIDVDQGIGVWVQSALSVELSNLDIRGPIIPEVTDSPLLSEDNANQATTGIYGLVVEDVDIAAVEDVGIRGFARFGAVLADSFTQWERGSIRESMRTSVLIQGGQARLTAVNIARPLQALDGAAYGLVISQGAVVETAELTLTEGEGTGILQDSASARHTALTVDNQSVRGMWVQNSMDIEISGSSRFTRNGMIGVGVHTTPGVRIQDLQVDDTSIKRQIRDDGSIEEIGDGIHIVDSTDLSLDRVRLIRNERSGLFLNIAASELRSATLSDIQVAGVEQQFGAVAQGELGSIEPGEDGWDDGITRDQTTTENDRENIEILPVIGPNNVSPPRFPVSR